MSNTVDNRAVHLGFENQQFEAGVKTSTESLEKFKKSLDLTQQAKSLQSFSVAGKSFNLGGIAEGVQNISNRFSTFGIVGMSVLQNLTLKAIEFGEKLWKALSEPAKKGFSEYEIQMNAIQTIMANTASKGTTLDQVNATLNELNTYADKTIYNFAEMAKNIGTFTAAGVDLQTSAAAIKGIGNLAAISGSNSQQAATAMYQLSQALASGTVKLMDWNSVTNAGMGGEVFKNALMETARVHGIAIDDIIKKEGSFRESLTTGWLSSSILTETLSKFTGDLTAEQLKSIGYTEEQIAEIQKLGVTANDAATKVKTFTQLKQTLQEALSSGWAKTWQIIVGDFEEAKSFFTYLSDSFGGLIQKSSDSRNAMLQGWKDLGGRNLAVQAIKNVLDSILSVMEAVGKAWKEVFPPTGSVGLFKITKAIKDFTEFLKPSEETIKKIGTIFKGLFSILDIGRMAISALLGSFGKLNTGGIKPLLSTGITYLSNLASHIILLRSLIQSNNTFGKALEKVKGFFATLSNAVIQFGARFNFTFDNLKLLIEGIRQAFTKFINDFKVGFNSGLGKAQVFIKDIQKGLTEFGIKAGLAFDKVKASIEPIIKKFGEFATSFTGAASNKIAAGIEAIKKAFGELAALLNKGFTARNNAIGGITGFFDSIKTRFAPAIEGLKKVLGQVWSWIVNAFSQLDINKIASLINMGLFASLLLAIKNFIKSGTGFVKSGAGVLENFGKMFSSVSGILDEVRKSLEVYQKNLQSKTLLNIAIAIGILAVSLLVISSIDPKKLAGAVFAITGLFAELVGSMKLLEKGGFGGGAAGLSLTLIAMSISLLLLTAAIERLGNIDSDKVSMGLVTLGLISAGVAAFMRLVGNNAKSFLGAAISLIVLSLGLRLIAGVIERLGTIKVDVLRAGLITIGVVLAELAAFSRLAGKASGIGNAVGIIALAGGILVMSIAIEKFGKMDVNVLKTGLIVLGAILLEIGAFIRLVGEGKQVISTAIGMAILSGSMLIFAQVITDLGKLSWEQIARGLGAMGGALLLIVGAMKLMPSNMLVSAIGLAVIAASTLLLADSLRNMASLKWEEIGRGLTGLAGALLIITLAMQLMQGAIGGALALLIVAGALAVLTPVLKALGSMELEQLGIALAALAGVFLIIGLAGLALTPLVPTLLALAAAIVLLGLGILGIGAALLMFSMGLATLAVSGVAGAYAFVAVVNVLLTMIPALITAFVNGIVQLSQLMASAAPAIGQSVLTIIQSICDTFIKSIPAVTLAITTMLDALWVVIKDQVPKAVEAWLFVISEMLASLAEKMPEIVQSGFDILIAYLQGIRDNIGEVVTVVAEIITEFLNAVARKIPDIIQSGVNVLISFIEGISRAVRSASNRQRVNAAIADLCRAIITGLTDGLLGGIRQITDAIGRISTGIINALKTLLGIASPSKVTTEIGANISEGLARGLLKKIGLVKNTAQEVAKKTLDSINEAIANINNGIYSEIDINPVIRPIVDLTDVINGRKSIENYLNADTIQLPARMDNLVRAAVGMSNQNGSNGVVNPIGNTVNFYQTNTSPKALSSFDIYRETRIQLLMLKGVVINQ